MSSFVLMCCISSTAKPATPVITSGVSDIYQGVSVSLSCDSTSVSTMTLTYQWFLDGTQLSGEFSSSYAMSSASASNDGVYTCKALVSDTVFSDASSGFTLSVRRKYMMLFRMFLGCFFLLDRMDLVVINLPFH